MKHADPEIAELIESEKGRQNTTLNMIPSENFCSRAVLEASGSILTNKYAEGYPGKRYYQGNEFVDQIENLAIERAKKLFGAEHANVQPLSGSGANMSIYFAMLNSGDKVMGMDLSHGGHLTHGHPVNFSGKHYSFVSYGVSKDTERLDMDAVRKMALQEKPKMIVNGYTAYPRTVPFREFAEIAAEIGAYSMSDISHIAGLVAGGAHPSPLPFTDVVMTTTHKTLRGPRSAIILSREKFAKQIDKAVFPGLHGGPHLHTIAAKAVCFREAMRPEFHQYAHQVVKNAKVLADTLMSAGVRLVSGGTDNHLILIDLIKTEGVGKPGLGRDAAVALEQAGIVANCNTIPFDPSTPFRPSGLRMGTPVLTTMGMKESEMKQVGEWVSAVIKDMGNDGLKQGIKQEVKELCSNFKFYN